MESKQNANITTQLLKQNATAIPRHKEEEDADKTNHVQIESTKLSSLFPKRGNRKAERTKNTRTK